MHDLPRTTSRKFAYADDLAIMHSVSKWQTPEGTLNQDITILSTYLQKWKLKLSITKTVTTLSISTPRKHDEAHITVEGRTMPFRSETTYHRQHLESLSKKLTARVGLLRRIAGSKWGSDAKTLRCAPV